jgi:hypothetical protein
MQMSTGCKPEVEADRKMLARVKDKLLYEDELTSTLTLPMSLGDSIRAITSLTEAWVKDELFLLEAEKKLQDRTDLEELINAYRNSLMTHLYEKQLVDDLLDSTITADELNTYYELNKEQYVLNTSILRCHLLKISKEKDGLSDIKRWWDKEEVAHWDSLIQYCNEHAEIFLLDDSTWYQLQDVQRLLPKNVLKASNISRIREERFDDDSSRYFLRILEQLPDTEIAPLSFIEKQASKVILHKRKKKLLETIKRDVYERGLKSNKVDIEL